jgi:predicted RNA binding protein YcfA (HicA-like mRNA interferase family)
VGDLPKQTKRRSLVKRFRQLGWSGPHSGVGDHPEYMEKDSKVQKIPNNHKGDIDEWLLKQVLSQAGISHDEWLGRTNGEDTDDDSDNLDDEDQDDHVEQHQESASRPRRSPQDRRRS